MTTNNIQDLIVRNGLKVLFAFTIIMTFFYILSPFIIPVILGGILAMAFSPFIGFFIKKGFTRKGALRLMTLIIFLVGVIPTGMFMFRGSRVITEMIKDPNGIMNKEYINHRVELLISKIANLYGLPQDTLMHQFQNLVQGSSNFLLGTFSNLLTELPNLALIAIITVFSVYFFLGHEEKIRLLFDRYFFLSDKHGNEFIKMMKSCCREVFFSNVLTGVIQSCVVSIGALVAGIGDAFLIFFITFIFSFIPVLGAGPVALILSLYAFLTGNIMAGILMMVVTVIAGLSDNIIRPYLASLGNVEVPPFIGFMAVIGGVLILGLPGLFVAPLAASLTFGMIPILYDEYKGNKED